MRTTATARAASRTRVATKPTGEPAVAPEPDLKQAQALVLAMLGIPGRSGEEGRMVQFVTDQLVAAGADPGSIRTDRAHVRSPIGGEVGNLILTLPGTRGGPRRMLMAHLDTVPLCAGARPVVRGQFVEPADKETALGADDRSGAAVVLTAALEILKRGLPHPPLTFLWTVQEEVGLYGARFLQTGLLARPKLAFNFDGGAHEKVTVGATGGYRMEIDITGRASHAGSAPEKGVSAIAIAALAVARLHEEGWHGRIEKNGRTGTSNIGVIHGGDATNVVTPRVHVRAEARSHDPAFRQRIVRAIEKAFSEAARSVRSCEGTRGHVAIEGRLDYEAFRLGDREPCVLAAEAALAAVGSPSFRAISNGGLDANWLTARGIPTVTLGCGQQNPHTTDEGLDLVVFRQACRVALRLATGEEGS